MVVCSCWRSVYSRVRLVIHSFRVLVCSAVCGSLVSCSLFRPKDDDATWGDPHWEFEDGENTQAQGAGADSGWGTPSESSDRRLVGSSREADYWPTTQELESRGGNFSTEEYADPVESALPETESPSLKSTFAFNEPKLPQPPADGDVDPLAGFWEDDHSDSEIRRSGDSESEPVEAAAAMSDTDATIALASPSEVAQPEPDIALPILAPIPPSPTPARGGYARNGATPTVSGFSSSESAMLSPPATRIPDVILLNSGVSAAAKSAFENVSLFSGGMRPARPRYSQGSLLDRRRRVSLTDMNALGVGPLEAPSIDLIGHP